MQKLYVNGKMLNVVRSFSGGPNKPSIMEVADGGFCYLDGTPVFDKNHFISLPKGHKERAIEWFKSTYGEKVNKVEPSTESKLVDMQADENEEENVVTLPELKDELLREGL